MNFSLYIGLTYFKKEIYMNKNRDFYYGGGGPAREITSSCIYDL